MRIPKPLPVLLFFVVFGIGLVLAFVMRSAMPGAAIYAIGVTAFILALIVSASLNVANHATNHSEMPVIAL